MEEESIVVIEGRIRDLRESLEEDERRELKGIEGRKADLTAAQARLKQAQEWRDSVNARMTPLIERRDELLYSQISKNPESMPADYLDREAQRQQLRAEREKMWEVWEPANDEVFKLECWLANHRNYLDEIQYRLEALNHWESELPNEVAEAEELWEEVAHKAEGCLQGSACRPSKAVDCGGQLEEDEAEPGVWAMAPVRAAGVPGTEGMDRPMVPVFIVMRSMMPAFFVDTQELRGTFLVHGMCASADGGFRMGIARVQEWELHGLPGTERRGCGVLPGDGWSFC